MTRYLILTSEKDAKMKIREETMVNLKGQTNLILLAGVAVGAFLASSIFTEMAVAQQASPSGSGPIQASTADSKNDGAVEEIVVTAERRTVPLQDTPIAMTALTPAEIEKKGVTQIQDLQYAVPSLSVTNTGLVSFINIRGIGIASGSGSVVPGVATLRDGLYQPPILSHTTFYDIADIEVLRGPQGTFIGTDSTGGAVLINSASPELSELYGRAEVQGGNYGDFETKEMLNLPVSDTLAIRIAGYYEGRDSFYKAPNLPSGATIPGSLGEGAARIGVLWKPTDQFTVLLKNEASDYSTGGFAYKPIQTTPYSKFASADPFTLDMDTPEENNEVGTKSSLELKYKFDNGITLRSLTGYQYNQVRNYSDSDGVKAPGTAASPDKFGDQIVKQKPFTQEFNVLSPDGEKLSWIAGVSYLKTNSGIIIHSYQVPATSYQVISEIDGRREEAIFGQAGYEIFDDLTAKVGMRYTHDDYDGQGGVYSGATPYAGTPLVTNIGHHSEHELTGKAEADYKLDPADFLYAFAAKGFKEGGFNTAPNATTAPVQFAPEVVYDYEVGIKSNWLNDHLKTQLDGFYMDYENLQISTIDVTTGRSSIRNVAKSTIEGFEASAQAKQNDFTADFSASYVYSTLGTLQVVNSSALPAAASARPQCNGTNAAFCFNYAPYLLTVSGKANPFSPRFSGNIGVGYNFHVNGDDILAPHISVAYQGSQWTTNIEVKNTDYLSAYTLVNVDLAYFHGPWQANLYATNLLDRTYQVGQSSPNVFYGPPRQYGVRLAREF